MAENDSHRHEKPRKRDAFWKNQSWVVGLVESAVDAIIVIDDHGIVGYANPATLSLFGYEEDEILGHNVHMLMPEPYQSAHDQYLANYRETGLKKIIGKGREVIGRRKDGSVFPMHLSISEVKTAHTRLFTGILRDISREKSAEEALRGLTARYEAILSAAPDMIVEVDSNFKHVWMNAAGIAFYGADAIGREPADYFIGPQQTYEMVRPVLESSQETIYVESWQRRKDGEPRLLAWWCRSLQNSEGKVIGALSTARDITRQNRNEQEQVRLLRELTDRNRIISCLYSVGEVIRSSVTDPELFEAVALLIRPACYRPEVTHARIVFDGQRYGEPDFVSSPWGFSSEITVAGRVRGTIDICYQLEDSGSEPRLYMREDRDLIEAIAHTLGETEDRRNAEARVIQASKLASIGELAAGVGHEINNPINGIMNCADILLGTLADGSKERKYAELVRSEADRVAAIVRSLLTFSRQDGGHHSLARLTDIVGAVLSLTRKSIAKANIELTVDVPENLPKVRCRSERIQQVVMNLIINAIHALEEKYPSQDPGKRLSISAAPIQNGATRYLRLTVEDWGTGIHPSYKDRLFEPFFTTKGRDRGTGLGLSVSDGIVKEHDGQITVESELGKFTRFNVDLPVGVEGDASASTLPKFDGRPQLENP